MGSNKEITHNMIIYERMKASSKARGPSFEAIRYFTNRGNSN